jgi:hypothetical protein
MHDPFVFFSIQPYPLVAISPFFLFRVCMGRCSSPILWCNVPHFSHCWMPSSLQGHWGRWCHTCLLWLACLFRVCMGECSPTLWSFPHNSHCYKLSLLQGCWAGSPLLHSLAILCIYSSHGGVLPPSPAQGALPSLLQVFFFFFFLMLVYCSGFFFSFFPGWGSVCQGAMLICPREYCMPLICSPGGLPCRVGAGVWWRGSPPGFSI